MPRALWADRRAMKKRFLQLCCAALIAAGLVFAPPAQAVAAPKPWRIALVTGGPFIDYQIALQGLAERLADLGIIADGAVPLPENSESLAPMWRWLAENAGGDSLRFVADALYSPEWDPDRRPEVKKHFLDRLRDKGDIDCILAFGTWVGQDIAKEDLRIPVLLLSTSNLVDSGIIPSPDDSGRDNLLAVVEPDKYGRQVRIFHKIIGFSRLGITYEDTPSGRAGVALMEIEAAAEGVGVELVRCVTAKLHASDREEETVKRLRACHEDIVKQGADAVYISVRTDLSVKHTDHILEPLIKAGLPTFAQQGSIQVRHGVMMSMGSGNLRDKGFFAAEALGKILKGALPRSLSQRFESTASLSVNLRTAALIGWNIPIEVLAAVDEFYRDF